MYAYIQSSLGLRTGWPRHDLCWGCGGSRGGTSIGAGGLCTPPFSNFSVFIVLTPPSNAMTPQLEIRGNYNAHELKIGEKTSLDITKNIILRRNKILSLEDFVTQKG